MTIFKEILVGGNIHVAVFKDGEITRISSGVCSLSSSRADDINSCSAASEGISPDGIQWESFPGALERPRWARGEQASAIAADILRGQGFAV